MNVYGILRAPRAPATEALVISAPYSSGGKSGGSTLPGIALIFALAKYFSTKNYWAKDIIFLVGDQDMLGIYAWLEAYHGSEKSNVLNYGFLPARGGQIQAALNLEIHSQEISRLELKIEGLNGQLMNLDLFNIAVELATRESVTPTFHARSHPFSPDPVELATEYALTTVSMMISQAKNYPSGAHGLFHKYAIQALTLEGIEKSSKEKDGYLSSSLMQVGLVVEGIVRSLNNLLERFNRSYWFYLLPSTRRYISIGYYMIPFGLITVPLLIKALSILLHLNAIPSNSSNSDRSWSFWDALQFNFFCHILGFVQCSLPWLFQSFPQLLETFNLKFSVAIHLFLITLSFIFMLNPLAIVFRSAHSEKTAGSREAHLMIALLNLALMLSCISLLNISLAFFLAIIMVPTVLLIGSQSKGFLSTIRRLISIILLIIIHPLTLLLIVLVIQSIWHNPTVQLSVLLNQSLSNHQDTILDLIEHWYLYGNWTYFFGCAFLFPVWMQFWMLS